MQFSEILSSLVADGDSQFRITVSDDWGQGRATYGGLVAAAGNEAMRRHRAARPTVALIADNLRRSRECGHMDDATRDAARRSRSDARPLRYLDGDQVVAIQVGVYGLARGSQITIRPPVVAAPAQDRRDQ